MQNSILFHYDNTINFMKILSISNKLLSKGELFAYTFSLCNFIPKYENTKVSCMWINEYLFFNILNNYLILIRLVMSNSEIKNYTFYNHFTLVFKYFNLMKALKNTTHHYYKTFIEILHKSKVILQKFQIASELIHSILTDINKPYSEKSSNKNLNSYLDHFYSDYCNKYNQIYPEFNLDQTGKIHLLSCKAMSYQNLHAK
jgi:hypothetical protein